LDISIYSSGFIHNDTKKRICRVELEKEAKRKKDTSPMHLTSSISATKVAVGSQTVRLHLITPPLTGNSLKKCLIALLIL
jgi:hypothetical protein